MYGAVEIWHRLHLKYGTGSAKGLCLMQTTLSEVAMTQSNQEFLNCPKGDTVILQSLIFGLACTEVLELYVV